MGSGNLQRKRDILRIIFSQSNEDLKQKIIFQISSMVLPLHVLFFRKSTSESFPALCFLFS